MGKPEPKDTAPPLQNRSRLTSVVRGRIEKPIRVVLYATDGLGKSTFASRAPSPIFIGAEDGTAQLDVARMPNVSTWRDILESVDELADDLTHDFKTIVLDTADWAEPMCWDAVCKTGGKADIEAFGYGKGYTAALEQWRFLLSRFETARNQRGMNIIVLAHSWVKAFKNPEESGDYDRYEMSLNAKAAGLLKQWADCVLFGNYETFTHEANGRTKGISTGARVIHTQRRAAFDAKNRFDLPDTLPLDWDAFAEAVAAHRPGDPAVIKQRIEAMIATADEALAAMIPKVQAAMKAAGDDAAELARIANKLSASVVNKETAS